MAIDKRMVPLAATYLRDTGVAVHRHADHLEARCPICELARLTVDQDDLLTCSDGCVNGVDVVDFHAELLGTSTELAARSLGCWRYEKRLQQKSAARKSDGYTLDSAHWHT